MPDLSDHAAVARWRAETNALWGEDDDPQVPHRREEIGGVPCLVAGPPPNSGAPVVLYAHGGGYVLGSAAVAIPITARLGRTLRVVSADYRQPPEHPFPAALDDVLAVYQALTAEYGSAVPAAGDVPAAPAADGVPVALGYCTLCLTALMFDRRLPDGDVLSFQTSGLLMDSNKIMIDNETESLWNHLSGTAFAGPLAGTKLEQFPVATVRWSDWLADHPDTFTLDTPPPTYFPEMPERPPISYDYTPGAAYRTYYSSEDLWFPTFETPDVLELKTEVVTVDRGGLALALGLAALEQEGPFVYVLGGEPLVIVPNQGGARVYSAAEVAGVPAEAWRHGAPVEVALGGVLHDELRVNGVDGRNRIDVRLPRIVSSQSFWFAWYGLHPDTEIWPPADG